MTNELYKGDYIHGKRTKKPMYYENVVEEITSYHGLGYYNDRDLHDIIDDTPREEEINNYIYEQNYGLDKNYDDRDIDI